MTKDKKDEKMDLKTKYHYNQSLEVKKGGVVVEKTRDNKSVNRIRFELTDGRKVTWKPRKSKTETSEEYGLKTETELVELFETKELVDTYPILMEIAKPNLKEETTVIFAFVEQEFYNEKEKEVETYYFMRDWQVEMLNDPTKQEEYSNRYKEKLADQ